MKVYFAGSIRGGTADTPLYARLIAHINGRGHRVLTEHVGAGAALETLERGMSDSAIWKQDMAWLRESDVIIAECSTPSLGVGYELAMAQQLGKPAYVFYRAGHAPLSAMLTGDAYYTVSSYTSEEDLIRQLDAIL